MKRRQILDLSSSVHRMRHRRALRGEALEPRTLLANIPNPIVPANNGEQNKIDKADFFEDVGNLNALDNHPVPVAAQCFTGSALGELQNKGAGSPLKLDCDNDGSTGNGGHDVNIEVNTELFLDGAFHPHLSLSIERIGSAPFAEDITVLVAFPFSAFTGEDESGSVAGDPNLFFGYQTTDVGGAVGGHAPLEEEFLIIPGIGALGGTDHVIELQMNTIGADNPLRFLAGHFDGNSSTGILNANAIGAHVETTSGGVPSNITIGLDVAESFPFGGLIDTSFGIVWDATEPAVVTFNYEEVEDFLSGGMDFGTTLVVDQMPTHEELTLRLSENPGFTLSHRGSSVIDELTFRKVRDDGMLILGVATDVPTEVDLTVDLDATSVVLDVNANTMDLRVDLIKEGGFIDTSDFLGYDIGLVSVSVEDAPDLTAGYVPASNGFGVVATNPGESIGMVEVTIDDNGTRDDDGNFVDVDLPPSYFDVPTHHLFSFVDDGTNGTVVARLVDVIEATIDLDADATEALTLLLAEAAPMQLYLRTTEDSMVVPEDAEVECNVDDVPAGMVDFSFDGPGMFSYETDSPDGIGAIHCFGHIGTLNFDVLAEDLPSFFAYSFDPNGLFEVLAQTNAATPNSDTVGAFAIRLWDADAPGGLPSTEGLGMLLGAPLRDAQARADEVPSFQATWSDGASTSINFDTGVPDVLAFLDGVQFDVSTEVELTTPLPEADPLQDHYVRLIDEGPGMKKRMSAGAFGIDQVSINTNDGAAELSVSYAANADHGLVVELQTAFGLDFFPNFGIHAIGDPNAPAVFEIDDVPQTFDLTLDLDPSLTYTASSPIDSITLHGTIDETNNGMADGTELTFVFENLPSSVAFNLDPASGADLTMNGSIDSISLLAESENSRGIFGTDYRLIDVSVTNIPAKWVVDWTGGGFLLEAKDAADNPQPMGVLSAVISTSNDPATNAAKINPFELNGGTRIVRSAFEEEVDNRYWPGSVETALNDLYGEGEKLDAFEDHAIARFQSDEFDFASLQFTGFQKIDLQPDSNGGTFTFRAPSIGLHPLYVGVGEDSEFTTLQIENVPDEMVLDADIGAQFINYDAMDDVDPSAGEIDFYMGPLPSAGAGVDATRIVMNDTPSFVHIDWGFGFPDGAVNFDASNEFQILFLNQSSSNRIVAGLEMEDLQIGYDIDLLPLTIDFDSITICPTGFFCPPTPEIDIPTSIDLRLIRAEAGIDNDAGDSDIDGNPAKPGVDGFFALYERRAAEPLVNPAFPSPGGQAYVPQLTFMMEGFREFSVDVSLDVEILPAFLQPQIDGPNLTLDGNFVFDVWSNADTDATFDVLGTGFGFRNAPDFTENSPFHIIPLGSPQFGNPEGLVVTFSGFHDFGDHVDPFALHTVRAGDSNLAEALSAAELEAAMDRATEYWRSQGVDAVRLAALDDVQIEIVDLPETLLGTAFMNRLLIDVDAAGHGWVIDPTEVTADGGIDLLSTVTHEIGHLLGFDHHDDEFAVMAPVIAVGQTLIGTEGPGDKLAAIRDLVRGIKPFGASATETLAGSIRSGIAWRTDFAPPVLLESRLRTLARPRDLMFADYRTKEAVFVEGAFRRPHASTEWHPAGTKKTSTHSEAVRDWMPEDSIEEVDATAVDSVIAEDLQWQLAS